MSGRRPLAATAAVAAVLLGATACADETAPSEDEFLHGAGGVHAELDGILLRDVSVDEPEDGVYESGDVARLRVVLLNETETADRLLDVTTPAARDARLLVDADCDGEPEQVGGIPVLPYPDDEPPVPVHPDGPEPFYRVDLLIDEQVRSGESLPVTFTFAEAGQTTVQVPVEPNGELLVDDDAECEPAD